MKKVVIIYAAALVLTMISCKSKDSKPQDPVMPQPTPVVVEPTPPPVVEKGVWCPSNEADFSPCNPHTPAVGTECEPIGKVIAGCKSVQCQHSCNPVSNFFQELF